MHLGVGLTLVRYDMIGIIAKDCHIHYVDVNYAVIDNPHDDNTPTIVKREYGEPDRKEVNRIVHKVGMTLNGEAFYREDGLWCHRLKPNGNGATYG